MNKLERAIYDLVKHNPRLKRRVRNIYQRLFDLLPVPSLESTYPIAEREGFFYGFHDHTPFSVDDSMLLANRHTIPLRMPRPEDELEVGYFDGPGFTSYHAIAATRAWNWHMGCKLQWCGTGRRVALNDHQDGRDVGRLVDLDSGEDLLLPHPVGSVSPNGRWAVGYSFARVERCMPGYGYQHPVDDPEMETRLPKSHGIQLIDLHSREARMIFSIADIASIDPTDSMRDGYHFLSHTVFSPDSKRFVFLHRWIHRDVTKRWSRLISSDLEGKEIHIFPTVGMASHIGWRDREHVIAYCRIAGAGDCYALFRDRDSTGLKIIGRSQFSSDGHPSFEPTGRWMVTDTYPDRRRRQSLILFDTQQERRFDLARLPSPRRFQTPRPEMHWACDLHPRWSRDGSYICFDSAHTGSRALCTIQVGRDLAAGLPLGL